MVLRRVCCCCSLRTNCLLFCVRAHALRDDLNTIICACVSVREIIVHYTRMNGREGTLLTKVRMCLRCRRQSAKSARGFFCVWYVCTLPIHTKCTTVAFNKSLTTFFHRPVDWGTVETVNDRLGRVPHEPFRLRCIPRVY